VDIRHRGQFAYVDGELANGQSIKLMRLRLRYAGSASTWGFALYLASSDKYEDTILPTGSFAGTPEEALDCACGLHLTAYDIWPRDTTRRRSALNPRRTFGADHLVRVFEGWS
jgi:hypothetical protein